MDSLEDDINHAHWEVEWLDEDGDGHYVTFCINSIEQRDKFIAAIENISMMTGVYKIRKERL